MTLTFGFLLVLVVCLKKIKKQTRNDKDVTCSAIVFSLANRMQLNQSDQRISSSFPTFFVSLYFKLIIIVS